MVSDARILVLRTKRFWVRSPEAPITEDFDRSIDSSVSSWVKNIRKNWAEVEELKTERLELSAIDLAQLASAATIWGAGYIEVERDLVALRADSDPIARPTPYAYGKVWPLV